MSPRKDHRLPPARLLSFRGQRPLAQARHFRVQCQAWLGALRERSRQRHAYGPSSVLELLMVLQLMWPVVVFAVVMLWVAGFSGSP